MLSVRTPGSPFAGSADYDVLRWPDTAPANCVATAKSTVCLATPAVAEAYRRLLNRTWAERAAKVGYAFAADKGGTRIRVTIDDAAAADRLVSDFGNVVSVKKAGVGAFSGSRTNCFPER